MVKAELEDFALMSVEENGGMKIKIKEIEKKQHFINIPVLTVEKNLVLMEIKIENNVATTATLKIDFGGMRKMEFKKLKISDLVPAAYNPRKKLKPGDKEFEKIKSSINEFGYVEPIIVNSDL